MFKKIVHGLINILIIQIINIYIFELYLLKKKNFDIFSFNFKIDIIIKKLT